MIDGTGIEVTGLNTQAVAAAVVAQHRAIIQAEDRLFQLAAHWADLHNADTLDPDQQLFPGAERAKTIGGDGTPQVREFAAAPLGALQQTTSFAAERLMADALDLRHRFPRVWRRICAGEVKASKARRLAQATRHLSQEAADHIDASVADLIMELSTGVFLTLVEAKIIEADPDGEGRRLKAEWAQRFVHIGQTNQYGLKTVFARADAASVAWFDAMIDHLADLLARQGDPDSLQVRRAKALGILARPDAALQLLATAGDQPLPGLVDTTADGTGSEDCGCDGHHGSAEHGRSLTGADPAVQARCADGNGRPGDSVQGDHHDREAGQDQHDGSAGRRHHARDHEEDNGGSLISESDLHPAERDCDPDSAGPLGPDADRILDALRRIDPAKLRPPVTLHFHIAEETVRAGKGVVRMEDASPITLELMLDLLRQAGCLVKLQPVLDPSDATPVTQYQTPRLMREKVIFRQPIDQFPYGSQPSRHLDLDHTIPYLPPARGGPPGQTNLGNLGPFSRTHHRIRTFAGWQLRQPEPGHVLTRCPLGYVYLVNPTGTHWLGNDTFAQQIWQAAAPATAQADSITEAPDPATAQATKKRVPALTSS